MTGPRELASRTRRARHAPSEAVGLPVVERLEVCEQLLVALHKRSELEHEPRAFRGGHMFAPGRVECLARSIDSEVDILRGCWEAI